MVVLLLGWKVLLLGMAVLDIALGVLVVLVELLGLKVLFISGLRGLVELLLGLVRLVDSSLLLVVVTPVWPVCTPSVTLVALRWPILVVLVSPSTVMRLIVGPPVPPKLVLWLPILSIRMYPSPISGLWNGVSKSTTSVLVTCCSLFVKQFCLDIGVPY